MKNLCVCLILMVTILLIGCSSSLASIKASTPNLFGKPDGVYRGEYNVRGTPVKVVLDVSMQDERITNITIIKHISSSIGKRAERIIPDIIFRQSLEVDIISGATGSSMGILKAVENALQ